MYLLRCVRTFLYRRSNNLLIKLVLAIALFVLIRIAIISRTEVHFQTSDAEHSENLNGHHGDINADGQLRKRLHITIRESVTMVTSKNFLTLHKRYKVPVNSENIDEEFYEAQIQKEDELKIEGLGDEGVAVFLAGNKEEMKLNGGFNDILSDRISYLRKVPDVRDPDCKNVTYDIASLPTASVVIVFHNEAWSVIIRTVHGVLDRTPERLLKEIVLVDDLSDRVYLKGKLDYYLKTRLPSKVRLVRLAERSGLTRAKLAGAREAKGDVLVFLDAHCEVGYTWMEPLLQRISEKRSAVVVPLIDPINGTTLQYRDFIGNMGYYPMGGFSWSGFFMYVHLSKREIERRASPISPTRSPTMIGGLFAIERNYFWEVGSYDSQMDIWGGENLEMSFRIWQCGGSVETIPCSRVGHIYRAFRPYSFPRIKDTHGYNTARLVEVWMDEYKEMFYIYRPDLKGRNIGDLTERQALRQKLKCKPFKWYLDNIYPELYIPIKNAVAYGQARNNNFTCLDNLLQKTAQYELGLYNCHSIPKMSQFFSVEKNGELRNGGHCAEIQNSRSSPVRIIMYSCHGLKGNQLWRLTVDGALVHVQTGLCLDANKEQSGSAFRVHASVCDGSAWQKWEWSHYKNLEQTFNTTQ